MPTASSLNQMNNFNVWVFVVGCVVSESCLWKNIHYLIFIVLKKIMQSHKTHTPSHTHTLTHTPPLYTHTPSHTYTPLTHVHIHTHPHTHTPPSHTLTHIHPPHTRTYTHTPSHTYPDTHTYTHRLVSLLVSDMCSRDSKPIYATVHSVVRHSVNVMVVAMIIVDGAVSIVLVMVLWCVVGRGSPSSQARRASVRCTM